MFFRERTYFRTASETVEMKLSRYILLPSRTVRSVLHEYLKSEFSADITRWSNE